MPPIINFSCLRTIPGVYRIRQQQTCIAENKKQRTRSRVFGLKGIRNGVFSIIRARRASARTSVHTRNRARPRTFLENECHKYFAGNAGVEQRYINLVARSINYCSIRPFCTAIFQRQGSKCIKGSGCIDVV